MKTLIHFISFLLFSSIDSKAQNICNLTVISTTPTTPGFCDGQVKILRTGCTGNCAHSIDFNSPNAIYILGSDTIFIDSLCTTNFQFAMVCDSSSGYCNITIGITGFDETENENLHTFIYPNPFSSFTTIKIKPTRNQDLKLKLCDITGKEIKSVDMKHEDSWVVNGLLFESGVYFLYIINNNELVSVKKILKL